MREMRYEKLPDGNWRRTEDDPEDSEYEFEDIFPGETIYAQIENYKKKGWKVESVDSPFNGFILREQ